MFIGAKGETEQKGKISLHASMFLFASFKTITLTACNNKATVENVS